MLKSTISIERAISVSMSKHFLPVNEYGHHKVKFRFEKYLDDSDSYTLHFSLDDGNTWKQVERFKDIWADGRNNPETEWGPKLIFMNQIQSDLEDWKKNIVSYSDFYEQFIARDVRKYEEALANYKDKQEEIRRMPSVINGF